MSNKTGTAKKNARKSKNYTVYALAALAVVILAFVLVRALSGGASNAAAGEDIRIVKSEVTETARFYPYRSGRINMEVMAVRASDGTIRTAFNTCQVCFGSGRAYYEQQGDLMVCQNCGNRFRLDDIEIVRGGCNPVPITEEYKIDDGTNIIISKEYMEANRDLFINWGKR